MIANDIITKIHDGVYLPGDRLPDMRSLSRQYGGSTQAVYDAVRVLEQMNYIVAEPHRGLFVSSHLQSGFYFRIGFFVDQINPVYVMENVLQFQHVCQREEFELIFGHNFETSLTLSEWLAEFRNLDALVLFGNLSQTTVDEAVRSGLPYQIWGNYHFPQKTYQQFKVSLKPLKTYFSRLLAPYSGKRISFLLGEPDSESDRQLGEILLSVAQEKKLICSESDLFFCSDQGYHAANKLFSQKQPEVLLICGTLLKGLWKFLSEHPEYPIPELLADERFLVNRIQSVKLHSYRVPDVLKSTARKLFQKLFREMERKYSSSSKARSFSKKFRGGKKEKTVEFSPAVLSSSAPKPGIEAKISAGKKAERQTATYHKKGKLK